MDLYLSAKIAVRRREERVMSCRQSNWPIIEMKMCSMNCSWDVLPSSICLV